MFSLVFFFGGGGLADSQHSNGYKLCPSPAHEHIPMLMRSGIIIVFAFSGNEMVSILSQLHGHVHRIDDILSAHNSDFEHYLTRMCSVELESKDMIESSTSASYSDLLLSIEKGGQHHTNN